MIAKLFNAPVEPGSDATGVSTVVSFDFSPSLLLVRTSFLNAHSLFVVNLLQGSSEAIILAVLAMKKKWKIARKAAGKSTENPNLVS